MRKQLRLLGRVLVGLLAATCGPAFDPSYRVNTMRVLVVSTSSPIARPGQTVTFTPLVYNPTAETLSWAWIPCPTPWVTSFAQCSKDLMQNANWRATVQQPSDGVASVRIPPLGPSDTKALLPLGVLAFACLGTVQLVDEQDPVTGPFRCLDATGAQRAATDYVAGLETFFVDRTEQNSNPVLNSITLDGADWAAADRHTVDGCALATIDNPPCNRTTMRHISVDVPASAFEMGKLRDGTVDRERITLSIYVTDGVLTSSRKRLTVDDASFAFDWTPRKLDQPHEARIYVVATDGRSGVGWLTRSLTVR